MQNAYAHYVAHKFGGSSLAQASRFIGLKSLLKGTQEIIIVSAVQGTTNALQNIIHLAITQKSFLKPLNAMLNTHIELIQTLLPENAAKDLISAFKDNIKAIKTILLASRLTGSCAKEIEDYILGYGEKWSAKILTAYLALDRSVLYLDASKVIFVEAINGIMNIDWVRSKAALSTFLQNKTFDQLVITGFIAATPQGKPTTLGRNGSDFSAAIFAKLLSVASLTIWTDVDGIFTADPKSVRSAFVIESLSYKEALELAYFGAKVLHPMTIAPLISQQTPIIIKNSLNPNAPGTLVSSQSVQNNFVIKGLTSISNVALVNIEGAGMIGVCGMAAKVFHALYQVNISVILISQASSEHSICFAIAKTDAEVAKKVLQSSLQFELERRYIEAVHIDTSCAIIAAVGDGMIGSIGIAARLAETLARAQINIHAISQGSSERNISVVIKNEMVDKALQVLHAGFFLARKTFSIGLIGPGKVGQALLEQLANSLQSLQEKYHVNLLVRGIVNSEKMLLAHHGLHLTTCYDTLKTAGSAKDFRAFIQHIKSPDIPHALVIDCTASQTIANQYIDFLNAGIHVITPNKHANAGDLNHYKSLKKMTQRHLHYLYEATVCAGLPVINTLQDILKTGDTVIKIEGIVSGTLSFIFNELAKGRLFSEVVKEAKARGFTEPDPREDLSGMDVARKLVCLGREVGFDVTLKDVLVHDLVPATLKHCSPEMFLAKLSELDDEMSMLSKNAQENQEKIAYVGSINQEGQLQVALRAYPKNHPFASLQGTDNMLVIYTQRYHEQPLVIQGPGAGTEVTAAGIFADLLRLVAFVS